MEVELSSVERTAVILDSLPLWVRALKDLAVTSGIRVVGTSSDAASALTMIWKLRPSLLITGIEGEGGVINLDVVRKARGIDPELKVIVISNDRDHAAIGAAFTAGADVYALKDADPSDLAAGMRQAFAQSFFVSAHWSRPADLRKSDHPGSPGLTRRELEILRLVAEGHTNSAMASMLWVTEQTVKFHLHNIYRKLQVSNRTEASRWAQLHGLLAPTQVLSPPISTEVA
jgi:DNA-binding NarL/FixJ family response regulator